jgi:HK97 family phage major capsid protein
VNPVSQIKGIFMSKLFEWKQEREALVNKADDVIKQAENGRRELTVAESAKVQECMSGIDALTPLISQVEARNTITKHVVGGQMLSGNAGSSNGPRSDFRAPKRVLSADYANDFYAMVKSNGKDLGPHLQEGGDGFGGYSVPGFSAALGEGTNSAGGYATPIMVSDLIVPLAPQEMAVRELSLVVPTNMDIKVPIKGSFGTTTAKAEAAAFTENDPTLGQFTLSAFMAGNLNKISWELAQDVPSFQSFCVNDGILAQQMYEENLYVNGTGTGQAQGLIGNVGAGTTQALSLNGILDLIATLNEVYHANASFLLQRATSIAIRKLQVTANLYEPVFTRVGAQDYLYGYPVAYSASMPANTGTNTPILFGDFKQGYVIGDRGGSGINVKILDQPFAVNGQIALIFYRRTDGRVRRSEAIQGYTL